MQNYDKMIQEKAQIVFMEMEKRVSKVTVSYQQKWKMPPKNY